MVQYSFFDSIMGKSKQKHKSTGGTQLSGNSKATRKGARRDVVYRTVRTSIENKTRGDV